ncbi:hypothetical protein EDB87DRAFT_1819419 [Lactarius vividus]|nr:hypothetical protein EDB87DRAFT_1819419 [Lactarius vividus]
MHHHHYHPSSSAASHASARRWADSHAITRVTRLPEPNRKDPLTHEVPPSRLRTVNPRSSRSCNSYGRPQTKKLLPSQKNIIVRPLVEFYRLCKTYQRERNDPERKAAREEFQYAMKSEFNDLSGSDEKDIENWHKLCYVLRIDTAPDTL